ncbi:NAD(P)-binding protein [Rhizodiscina lignyota]|uniref:NAD(P)-binding protein n=1 Tax=Rhizodiscina lignyota TaxID=1504668 RepID=A0A9P4M0U8_9PEZI|nr:NAD(P)-binding protein [Rhizodiscina lignyota]
MDASSMPAPCGPDTFTNRTVIVSGGTGKLGRVICRALAEGGANVVVNDINAEATANLVEELVSDGRSAYGITLSAVNGSEIISQTVSKFGRVDAVVNPILGAIPWKHFENLTDDDFRASFEANVLAPISIAKAAWPHFKAQNYGRIVNFTSDGMLGFPTASTYTFSKGALFGVNKTLAMEGAPFNIKVNCVSPIAYAPTMERHIQRFSEDVQELFKTRYKPEGNVPMILALASEGCKISGEVFNTSGWAVGKSVWGVLEGDNQMRTVEECLLKMDQVTTKNTKEVYEPGSMVDFTEFQSNWILGKDSKSKS